MAGASSGSPGASSRAGSGEGGDTELPLAAGAGGPNPAGTDGSGADNAGSDGSGVDGSRVDGSGVDDGDDLALADAGEPAPARDAGGADAGDAGAARRQLDCGRADRANCDVLVRTLIHRYGFEGLGTNVVDAVSGADGTLEQAQLSGSGSANLPGDGAYVDLPNGIVSALPSATFEVWLEWAGGAAWQRIFDFGSTKNGREDEPQSGAQYLFLTPHASDGPLRVAFRSPDTTGEVQVNAPAALLSGVEQHLAVVVNGPGRSLALFQQGELVGSAALPSSLAAIDDVNNWLGRSQFAGDAAFDGRLIEFRIYRAALNAEQVALSFRLGADAPLAP